MGKNLPVSPTAGCGADLVGPARSLGHFDGQMGETTRRGHFWQFLVGVKTTVQWVELIIILI